MYTFEDLQAESKQQRLIDGQLKTLRGLGLPDNRVFWFNQKRPAQTDWTMLGLEMANEAEERVRIETGRNTGALNVLIEACGLSVAMHLNEAQADQLISMLKAAKKMMQVAA